MNASVTGNSSSEMGRLADRPMAVNRLATS